MTDSETAMPTFAAHPTPGLELDWLAVDHQGHVGLFLSGGYGPVPREVIDHLHEVEVAVGRVGMLPVVGACAVSPQGDGDFSDLIEPARRGFFGFDWGPVRNPPYARLTVPATPMLIDDIHDPHVRAAAALVALPVNFEETTSIAPAVGEEQP